MKKSIIGLSLLACAAVVTSCGTVASAAIGGIANNVGKPGHNGTTNTTNGSASNSSSTSGSSSDANSHQTGGILGGIFGSSQVGSTIGNVLGSVLGLDKLSEKQLIGTWRYKGPGCAFTSDNALAKAGGEVAATEVKEKLAAQYAKLGLSADNTYITFNSDNTYTACIAGKKISGKFTYSESDGKLEMKALLITLSGYAKKNSDGIGVLFESKKVLTLLQTLAAVSGNSTLSTIGDLSKNYDGVRVGFDMTK